MQRFCDDIAHCSQISQRAGPGDHGSNAGGGQAFLNGERNSKAPKIKVDMNAQQTFFFVHGGGVGGQKTSK